MGEGYNIGGRFQFGLAAFCGLLQLGLAALAAGFMTQGCQQPCGR
jgi:hypothetical protein